MTIVMQSSSAAAATTLVALNAGSLTFVQGCAMIVGQSIGSAATTALVVIGGSLAVRRARRWRTSSSAWSSAFSASCSSGRSTARVRVGARSSTIPTACWRWRRSAASSSSRGSSLFYPWLDHFARFIERISGSGERDRRRPPRPVARRCGGSRRARGGLAGDPGGRARRRRCCPSPARGRIGELRRTRRSGAADRAVPRVTLAGDHRPRHDRAATGPPVPRPGSSHGAATTTSPTCRRSPAGGSRRRASRPAPARWRSWLDATSDPEAPPDAAVLKALEDAAQAGQRRTDGEPPADCWRTSPCSARPRRQARSRLETLVWADGDPPPRVAAGRIAANRRWPVGERASRLTFPPPPP